MSKTSGTHGSNGYGGIWDAHFRVIRRVVKGGYLIEYRFERPEEEGRSVTPRMPLVVTYYDGTEPAPLPWRRAYLWYVDDKPAVTEIWKGASISEGIIHWHVYSARDQPHPALSVPMKKGQLMGAVVEIIGPEGLPTLCRTEDEKGGKGLYIEDETYRRGVLEEEGPVFLESTDGAGEAAKEKEAKGKKHVQSHSNKAEQGGAGQPATRSESDLEGGDKPQPGSEGRSR